MKVIYIAGPFRGANHWEVEQNIRRAEAAALEVWRLGAAAICPHANTRFFSGVLPDTAWLDGDLEILERCDAVLLTKDWLQSLGARAEVTRARCLGKPVFYLASELAAWLVEVNECKKLFMTNVQVETFPSVQPDDNEVIVRNP